MPQTLTYPYGPTGQAATNRIVGEEHVINTDASRVFVPEAGPFFTQGLIVRSMPGNQILQPGVQYKAVHLYKDAVLATGKEVCAVMYITDPTVTGTVTVDYSCVGGDYSATVDALNQLIATLQLPGAGKVAWGQILGIPNQFPPAEHLHHASQIYGLNELLAMLENLRIAILSGDGPVFQMVYQYIDQNIQIVSDAIAAYNNVQNYGLATMPEAYAGGVTNK